MNTLTRKEEEIMNLYWEHGDMKVSLLQTLYDDPKPHVNTLSTMIHILEKKGFLSHRALTGKNYEYFAITSKDEYSLNSLKGLVDKFYGKSCIDAISALLADGAVTANDLKKLAERPDYPQT